MNFLKRLFMGNRMYELNELMEKYKHLLDEEDTCDYPFDDRPYFRLLGFNGEQTTISGEGEALEGLTT